MADEEGDSLDNWEEQADSGMLDRRLEEMSIDLQNKEEKKKLNPGMSPGGLLVSEDGGRTQYQPQVRILRREAKSPSSSPSQNHSNNTGSTSVPASSSKHSKSYQQREAEYAQARLRIFGSPPPVDDDEDDETGESVTKECINSIDRQSSPQIMKPDLSSPHVSVLRQPKGPDGTSGFKQADLT